MADETRLKIIKDLLEHSFCVRALAKRLGLSEATVSQHLKMLREAGLVKGEKRGYFSHYTVDREQLLELAEFLRSLAMLEQQRCPSGAGRCEVSEHCRGN